MVENEQEKQTFEDLYNKKERLKVIKQGILTQLNRVGQSKRGTLVSRLHELKMDENPYEVYRGGKSRKVVVHPTNEEITYCLNYLKDKELITYDEGRKVWISNSPEEQKKKGSTLEDFL